MPRKLKKKNSYNLARKARKSISSLESGHNVSGRRDKGEFWLCQYPEYHHILKKL
jgi:hypothetical protein